MTILCGTDFSDPAAEAARAAAALARAWGETLQLVHVIDLFDGDSLPPDETRQLHETRAVFPSHHPLRSCESTRIR
jgi:hypothetical protein